MQDNVKHEGCERQFIHTGRAWYGESALLHQRVIDEIMIGMYHSEGGTSGEFAVRWSELAGRAVPMLCVFDDAWDALQMFRDVLEAMARVDDQNVTPDQFCELLSACGVKDATPYKNPSVTSCSKPDRLFQKPDSKADIEAGK